MLSDPAWEFAVTKTNIRSGFEKTSLELCQPSVLLDKLSSGPVSIMEDNEDHPSSLPVNPCERRTFLRDIIAEELTFEQLLKQRDLMGEIILNLSSKYDLVYFDN